MAAPLPHPVYGTLLLEDGVVLPGDGEQRLLPAEGSLLRENERSHSARGP